MEVKKYITIILTILSLILQTNADPLANTDKEALLDFINTMHHSRYLNWNPNTPVCNQWTGITCNKDGSRVTEVRLPGMGFRGQIPPNTIGRLTGLQVLSLRSNAINGGIPYDFVNLRDLSGIYLQFNNLSGELPVDFSVWKNLSVVNFSNNRFTGRIPSSLSNLTLLQALNLANNSLCCQIPELSNPHLQLLNLSNNILTGTLPISLRKFPNSAFAGNNLSPATLSPELPPTIAPSSEPNEKKPGNGGGGSKLRGYMLWIVIIVASVILLVAFSVLVIICCFRKKSESDLFSENLNKGQMSPEKVVSRTQDANNRLFFFEGCTYAFDLEDLLRASAEVLGKGTFGISYKAVLEDATSVVVKRLKEVHAGKRDFEQQMEVVGSIKHENVVELKAYYYSKDEKLMVYDYYSQGSVSAMLHGKNGEGKISLDWDRRMKIAVGTARGIACIHETNGGKLVHGNIKSANIFLNPNGYGCVSDLGLITIMSPLAPPISRAAGYRAPEVTDTRKTAQSADVYSFGVVLLELLTGKSPIHTIGGDEIVHLVRWVHSVVREEWTAEVFDVELLRYPNIEEEMVEMLQIAMSCVVRMPDQRPKMADVVKMMESVRQFDATGNWSGNKSENSTPTAPTPPPGAATTLGFEVESS
ncbi:hypothetical protein ACFE04_012145 [Oxalis oulophora]